MIGADLRPTDAVERVVGTLPFVLDKKVEGMVHAAVVRSTFPHARIVDIDTEAALQVEGVLTVLTGADLAAESSIDPYFGGARKDQPILAIGKVRYVGDPVALVVAEDKGQAEEAASLVYCEYDELPFVESIEDAMVEGAPAVHDDYPDNACGWGKLRWGDVEQGFDEADLIAEGEYMTPAASHVPMEPFVTIAEWKGNKVDVWTAAQAPHSVRRTLASIFGLEQEDVRVQVLNLGGGYGAKGQTKIEPMAAVAARAVGRPVRLELTREGVFFTIGKHAARIRIKTGVKRDGSLVARLVDVAWNAGAYAVVSPRAVIQGMARAPGPYRIPNVWVDSRAYYTNTVPTGPFRGAMTTQVAWAYESQMDEIANQLGMDPLEVRRRNLLREGDLHPTGQPMHDVHFVELIEDAAAGIEWGDTSDVDLPPNKVRGKGLGVIMKSTVTPSRSEARIELRDDGSVVAYTSSVEMGQGAATTLLQILSHHLGIGTDSIRFVHPDTDVTPFDLTTSSSRTTFSMGAALEEASVELKHELTDLASSLLEASPADLVHEDGGISVVGQPGTRLEYLEILRRSKIEQLDAEGVFQSEGGLDPETGQGVHTIHWHQGAAGVEVEVDLDTGKVEILRCHGTSWAGRVVNPLRARQQNEGNVVWGTGLALFEELVFDEGQMVNPNLSEYLIPSILDMPRQITTREMESSEPDAELHGIGEMVIPALPPAVGNAVYAATGVRIVDLPITAERVLRGVMARRDQS